LYGGPNATKVFMEKIREVMKTENTYDEEEEMLPLTEEEEGAYMKAKKCKLCKTEYDKENKKFLHHDHLNGKYIVPSCNTCNLKLITPQSFPVFIHNLAAYGVHLLIKELAYVNKQIYLIPNNEEKYISFSKKTNRFKIRFLDSFKSMSSVLDHLSENLKQEQMLNIKKYFPEHKVDLVIQKGVYPYDYMYSWGKFEETKAPSLTEFYRRLNESDIEDDEYIHAQKIINFFYLRR
jgi:hypothetical protein